MGKSSQSVDRSRGTSDPWPLRYGGVIILIGGTLTIAIGLASVFWLPTIDKLVGDFTLGDLQRARADLRSSGLKLATGVGAATAGLLAWGRLDLSRQQHWLDEQSKRDERFARSVELLGSDKGSVRLGALYALEGLAKDGYSHQTIYDVVTAFARSSSSTAQVLSTIEEQSGGVTSNDSGELVLPDFESMVESGDLTADDFEAAITICLRCPAEWGVRLDLRRIEVASRRITSLDAADFTGSRFVDCRFEEGELSGCSFVDASLDRCRFASTLVSDSRFHRATLNECSFRRVEFVGTYLASAEFVGCDFQEIASDPTSSWPDGLPGSASEPEQA